MKQPKKSTPDLTFAAALEYAPSPETFPLTLKKRYELFIDGKFVAPKTGKYFASVNPATGKRHSLIAEAGKADLDAAVKSARRAFEKTWGPMAPSERGKYLFRIARLLQEKARELAVLETMDGGKPIRESRDFDLPLVAAHFFHHAG
jgi:aldehyde dehydrogenase (NAD+)